MSGGLSLDITCLTPGADLGSMTANYNAPSPAARLVASALVLGAVYATLSVLKLKVPSRVGMSLLVTAAHQCFDDPVARYLDRTGI